MQQIADHISFFFDALGHKQTEICIIYDLPTTNFVSRLMNSVTRNSLQLIDFSFIHDFDAQVDARFQSNMSFGLLLSFFITDILCRAVYTKFSCYIGIKVFLQPFIDYHLLILLSLLISSIRYKTIVNVTRKKLHLRNLLYIEMPKG